MILHPGFQPEGAYQHFEQKLIHLRLAHCHIHMRLKPNHVLKEATKAYKVNEQAAQTPRSICEIDKKILKVKSRS